MRHEKNILIAFLLLLVVVLLSIGYGFSAHADSLLATNHDLVDAIEPPTRPVIQDADITAFHNEDGTITIMVNGFYPHVITDACKRL